MTLKECHAALYESYVVLRDRDGLKDAQVAKRLGYDRSFFSEWKAGKMCPKINKILEIADLFGVTIDSMLKRSV